MRFTWDQGNGFAPMRGGIPNPGQGLGGTPRGLPPMGMPPTGRPPTGMMPPTGGGPPTGRPPMGMSPNGRPPMGMPGPTTNMPGMGSMGSMPGMGNMRQMGQMPMNQGMPGGTIRNNLGAELKKRGFFQKDGKIQNLRGGFFGAKSHKEPVEPQVQPPAQPQEGGNMRVGPFSFLGSGGGPSGPGGPGAPALQHRQLILEAGQPGINASGIASISPDNVFSCIANLPPPSTLLGGGPGTYAAYLVDGKGQNGFLAGILRPAGNGVYQAQFRSQVPLSPYNRVMITVENPQHLGHVPQGPVVLQVKQPPGPIRFLSPLKKAGGSVKKAGGAVWNKLSGLIPKKAVPGVIEGIIPEGGAALTEGGIPLTGGVPTGAVESVIEGGSIFGALPPEL